MQHSILSVIQLFDFTVHYHSLKIGALRCLYAILTSLIFFLQKAYLNLFRSEPKIVHFHILPLPC